MIWSNWPVSRVVDDTVYATSEAELATQAAKKRRKGTRVSAVASFGRISPASDGVSDQHDRFAAGLMDPTAWYGRGRKRQSMATTAGLENRDVDPQWRDRKPGCVSRNLSALIVSLRLVTAAGEVSLSR